MYKNKQKHSLIILISSSTFLVLLVVCLIWAFQHNNSIDNNSVENFITEELSYGPIEKNEPIQKIEVTIGEAYHRKEVIQISRMNF